MTVVKINEDSTAACHWTNTKGEIQSNVYPLSALKIPTGANAKPLTAAP